MAVDVITPAEVVEHAVDVLGHGLKGRDIANPEFLAASLRRAASFLCPTTPGLLVRSVDEVLAGLPGYSEDTKSLLEDMVEALVLHGDLLELPVEDENGRRRHLYLGPPAFVPRQSGFVLLLGVRPEGAPVVPSELSQPIEHNAHTRLLGLGSDITHDELLDDGLIEVDPEQWLRCPQPEPAAQLQDSYRTRVLATGDAGPVEGVRVLDPTRPSTYYRGRWRELSPLDEGMFVARRPQAYGADLWSFVEVSGREVRRGIDLPIHDTVSPAADEAWRLQAAIDATGSNPQVFGLRAADRNGWSVLDLFSPIPSWAQRRLDVVGTPIPRSRGALLSYAVPTTEVGEESQFLEKMMWLRKVSSEESSDA